MKPFTRRNPGIRRTTPTQRRRATVANLSLARHAPLVRPRPRVPLWVMLFRALWRSVTIGRLFGVPVQFHTTTLLYPAGAFLWFGMHSLGRIGAWLILGFLAIFWLSLLVHEFAHILTARKCGIGTERMMFHPFGAVAVLNGDPRMGREFWIALAGPLASLALAGVFLFAEWKVRQHVHDLPRHSWREYRWLRDVATVLKQAAMLNGYIAIFNMIIPVYPMDGARVLRSLIAIGLKKFTRRTREKAMLTATWFIVRCVSWPLVIGAGLYVIGNLFSSEYRMSALLLLPDAILGVLLLSVGEMEYGGLREENAEAESQARRRVWDP